MAEPIRQASNEWVTSTAVVTGCKRTFATSAVDESAPVDYYSYELAEFIISFSYEAEGKSYNGRYKSGVPRENGYSFQILYDPQDPTRNTASEAPENGLMAWPKWKAACAIAITIAVLLIVLAYFEW